MVMRIVQFMKGNDEYVVIISDPLEDPSEHCKPGYTVMGIYSVDLPEMNSLPTDRPLIAEY